MVPKRVGAELRRRRNLLGLSQSQVAKAVGVSRAYIGNVENGVDWEPDGARLTAWALVVGYEPEDLFRQLGRAASIPEDMVPMAGIDLTAPALLAAIRREVQAGVEAGVAAALAERESPSRTRPFGRRPDRPLWPQS